MLEFDPIGAFVEFVLSLLTPFINFILGFFPDADPQVYAVIDAFGNAAPDLTFNVFWFVEWSAVGVCFNVLVVCTLVFAGYRILSDAIDMISQAIEKIPFIE